MTKRKNLQPIDTPLYSYRHGIYRALYSKSFYLDVIKRWRGIGFVYLLFIMALLGIPTAIQMAINFNNNLNDEFAYPLEHVPPLYVQHGEISFDKPMPYFVKNKKGDIVLVIDTTGAINDFDEKKYPKLNTIILRNKILFKQPKGTMTKTGQPEFTVLTHELNKNDNEVFVASKWLENSRINQIKTITYVSLYPMVVTFFTSLFFVLLLSLGLLGQVAASTFFDVKLKYKQATRLAIVASTPMIYLFFLSLLFQWSWKWGGLIYVIVLSFFFGMAVLYYKLDSKRLVHG